MRVFFRNKCLKYAILITLCSAGALLLYDRISWTLWSGDTTRDIVVHVEDSATGQPVHNALVQFHSSSLRKLLQKGKAELQARTDSNGEASFPGYPITTGGKLSGLGFSNMRFERPHNVYFKIDATGYMMSFGELTEGYRAGIRDLMPQIVGSVVRVVLEPKSK